MKNQAINEFQAVINGQVAGLAGCTKGCAGCLRADPMLRKEVDHNKKNLWPCRWAIQANN